ncbi:hypothetical protein [Streptomyces virginiae]|uniref:hypothetical protein n=1 Tax=Streptomyces virginiae TaxID=1961 RepID=UPI00224F02F7|nr:hypothetical protein [Streptomyces virginiae]MCX5176014.1 hypothetical protein [Streptomyces virginiae]
MGTSVPDEPACPAPQPAPDAGEPACLLHLVCDACGGLATERDAECCARCGTPRADGNPMDPWPVQSIG